MPASQEAHVADELAPVALEYLPASQEVHVDAPASLEYVPAVQATVTDVPDTPQADAPASTERPSVGHIRA